MIEKAKDLNKGSQQTLLAYLHYLHMLELINRHPVPIRYHWAYPAHFPRPSTNAHWLRPSSPPTTTAHWV